MKKYLALLVLLTCMLVFPRPSLALTLNKAVFSVNVKNYSVNDVVHHMDEQPFMKDNRIFVPYIPLMNALGVDMNNTIWNPMEGTLVLHANDSVLMFKVNENNLYKNNKAIQMDVAPVIKSGTFFLPAKWVAEALGYAVGWNEKYQIILLGPSGALPPLKPFLLTELPTEVRPCQIANEDLWLKKIISSSSILFTGDYQNVYNAGVAAQYTNGYVLEPGGIFSFDEVVGERTTKRGFITGYDILDNLTVGGGVCRTSTVLYQAAMEAGLRIIERHPHYRPVGYTPPGTDASVSWGTMDLKFENTLKNPIIIHSGLDETGKGRRLWAEFWQKSPLEKVRVAILKNAPGKNPWQSIEKVRLTALLKNGIAFVSLEQLSDLLGFPLKIVEQDGIFRASVQVNNQLIVYYEGSEIAEMNGSQLEMVESPFRLDSSNCKYWVPFRDLFSFLGAEIQWIDQPQPSILLNLSGVSLNGR